jgi:hypothetical protein
MMSPDQSTALIWGNLWDLAMPSRRVGSSFSRGTEGSNPLSSREESGANFLEPTFIRGRSLQIYGGRRALTRNTVDDQSRVAVAKMACKGVLLYAIAKNRIMPMPNIEATRPH